MLLGRANASIRFCVAAQLSTAARAFFPEILGALTLPLTRYHGEAEESSVGEYGWSFAIRLSSIGNPNGLLCCEPGFGPSHERQCVAVGRVR